MRSEILAPNGAPAEARVVFQEPRSQSGYFGWIDSAGDPATIRMDQITAVVRHAQTGRFVILIKGTTLTPQIMDADAFRLLKRMGWTIEHRKEEKAYGQVP